MRHPFRRKNLSARLLPYYVIALLALLLAEPTPRGFAAGGAIVLAGMGLRWWGAGHLVKNDRLTVSGPYAHLRHPLYAGTLLLGVGFSVIAGGWALALLLGFFLPVFFLYYFPYKERIESARLERRYGAAYAAYRTAVPALLPALSGWSPPSGHALETRSRWSRERLRDNGELGTLLGIAGALLLLVLNAALLP